MCCKQQHNKWYYTITLFLKSKWKKWTRLNRNDIKHTTSYIILLTQNYNNMYIIQLLINVQIKNLKMISLKPLPNTISPTFTKLQKNTTTT